MENIHSEQILKLYSEAVQVPVRCFLRQERAMFCCPLSKNLPQDELEDDALIENMLPHHNSCVFVNPYGEVYGLIAIHARQADEEIYITGPGRLLHVSDAEFKVLYPQGGYQFQALERKMVFNRKMTRMNLGRMKILLGMLFYMRTDQMLVLDDIHEEIRFKMAKETSTPSLPLATNEYYNTSGSYEHELIDIVSHGKMEALKSFFAKREHVSFGTLSDEILRHQKNLGIVTVTIVSRAAVEGGMNEEYAYHLSDNFIKELEKARSLEYLDNLIGKMILRYTQEVHQIQERLLSKPVRDAQGYIAQYYWTELSVTTIAKNLGYSPNYLGSLFKKETGISMHEFIVQRRLEQAEYLLCSTNMSITEISSLTGFSSSSHFCRLFKDTYKKSPKEYRIDH